VAGKIYKAIEAAMFSAPEGRDICSPRRKPWGQRTIYKVKPRRGGRYYVAPTGLSIFGYAVTHDLRHGLLSYRPYGAENSADSYVALALNRTGLDKGTNQRIIWSSGLVISQEM
jgi:hypothetical protein